jgi:hypothetical protein
MTKGGREDGVFVIQTMNYVMQTVYNVLGCWYSDRPAHGRVHTPRGDWPLQPRHRAAGALGYSHGERSRKPLWTPV